MLPMTPRQYRALDRFVEAEAVLAGFHGHESTPELEADELFCVKLDDAIKEMDRALGAIIRTELWRTNLLVHVALGRWLYARRVLGQRDVLRSIHKGLEKGVRAPMTPENVLLEVEIVRLHDEGFSPEDIGEQLEPPISRQAVEKRLKKLRRPR